MEGGGGGLGGWGGNVGLGPSRRSSQSYISKGEGEINKIKGWGGAVKQ